MPSRHLLLISLGPVQDFIASARRSRDLWFGSYLLSELSKAAARAVYEQEGKNLQSLIFPAPDGEHDLDLGQPEGLSVANKILAKVAKPEEVAEAAQKAVTMWLEELRDGVFQTIRGNFDREVAKLQIADLVEFNWAAVILERDEDYPQQRSRLEAIMAARKATRNFAPVAWGANMPKSSLDGQRESVISEAAYNRRPGETDKARAQRLYQAYGVRVGERLDGVGLLKRHGERGKDVGFFSTSHVAALSLLGRMRHLEGEKLKEAREARKRYLGYIEWLGDDFLGHVPGEPHPVFERYDGRVLFKERLSEFVAEEVLKTSQDELKVFLRTAADGKAPIPYYVLLHADGDRMGKTIDSLDTEEKHREFSRHLSDFAKGAREIVNEARGSLVYAGGDDVLAFLPLHTALTCAQRLSQAFVSAVGRYALEGHEEHPTLSAGMVIAHHLDPLADVLELAREAERAAKRTYDRNAVAVTLAKRGGADFTVGGKWGSVDQRLMQFTNLHRLEAVPDGAAFELRELARVLKGEAARLEAIRILKRKRAKSGREALAERTRKELETHLETDDEKSGKAEEKIASLANELIVARILAEAADLADMPIEALREEDVGA